MDIAIRHNPAFSVARVNLAGNELIKIESGSMMASSSGVTLESKMDGGVIKALKRAALTGESFFISKLQAPSEGGWVDIVPPWPGDVIDYEVTNEEPVFITAGSWLASEESVELDQKWGGFKSMFGGEGAFVARTSGRGTVLTCCYGALDKVELAAGESFILDSGHAVAWSHSVEFSLRKAGGKIIQAVKSGEGFVFEFRGPGWVATQSRNPNDLLQLGGGSANPESSGGTAGNLLGGLFGN